MILAGLCVVALAGARLDAVQARNFRGDVDAVVAKIEILHPAPFARADKAAFFRDAAAIRRGAAGDSLGCATAKLMALVAELHDGHTYVAPNNVPGLERWYPIRFYAFPEGLFVTAAAPEYSVLVGRRILRIGSLEPAAAMKKIDAIQAANNPLAAPEGAVWLSNGAIAQALGGADARGMTVTVAGADGTPVTRTLSPFEADINDAWYQQGEMFGPRRHKDAQPYVTAFGGRGPLDFRKTDPALPPHLRYRLPYYFVEMPERKALYMQWNFVQDWGDEPFDAFLRRMFVALDAHPDWKLIIDVRYNSGGDGSKVPQLIRQIIKRDRFDKPGGFYVLIGRKTFSAAVDFVGEAKEWTSAVFVGEPTGAGVNAYGDPQDDATPNLHIPYQVSTSYHQHQPSTDQRGDFVPDIPAIMTAASYFSGTDPVLDAVLTGSERLPLPALAEQAGGSALMAAYARREAMWANIPWWIPFAEHDMNEAGYVLLRGDRKRDAIVAFRMNTERFPQSWNTWDSLAEAERSAGDITAATADYKKALSLNPGADDAKQAIDEMTRTGR